MRLSIPPSLLCLALGWWMCTPHLTAQQTDTLARPDTANQRLLNTYRKQQAELEASRRNDSAERARLEEKLLMIAPNQQSEFKRLQQELLALRSRDSLRLELKRRQIDSLRSTADLVVVEGFFNDTLLVLYEGLGSFTASERAAAIENRIKKLGNDLLFAPDSLKLLTGESIAELVAGDQIVLTVNETDGVWNNTTPAELARSYRENIVSAIKEYRRQTSLPILLKEIALALLVVGVLVLMLYLTNRLFRFVQFRMIRSRRKLGRGLKVRNYEIFTGPNLMLAVNRGLRVVKWLAFLLLSYLALTILFGIFPYTQRYAERLFGYLLGPLRRILGAIWHFLPNLFTIIVIIFFIQVVIRIFQFFKHEISSSKLKIDGFYPEWANPTFQLIRILLYAFMLILIFPYLPGSDSEVFKGVTVFLGFLFTFTSASSLSNVISGIVLTYMRSFKVGDRVKIGETTGDIIERTTLVTRLRTIKNEVVSIPNTAVLNAFTTNYSQANDTSGLIIHTRITIGYDVPWKNMQEALIDAARRCEGIETSPAPFVLQTALHDFYVEYEINAFTRLPHRQAFLYSQLHAHILDACHERGIEIMSPHYIAARGGGKPAVPGNDASGAVDRPDFNLGSFGK